jgi:hypothetical protein
MALTETQKTKVRLFVTELEKVGEDLIRYRVFKSIDSKFGSTYWNTLREAASTPEEIQLLIKKERDRYVSENIDMIDPETVYNILNGIMWPSISSVDVAMVDHPSDPNLTSMRGVTMRVVYNEDNRINVGIWNTAFDLTAPSDHAVFGSYQKTYDDMVSALSSTLSESSKKELLGLVFKSEIAAKCWWINVYGRQPSLGNPIKLIASLNAYLGYFTMMIGWLQGTGALVNRGITNAIKSELTTFPNIDSGPLSFDTTSNSLDVKSVSATIKAIQQNYKWLQAQKTHNTNKEYYEGWFDRFFNIPKSIVNMLIIINERVHLNINKEFTYSPKASVRLTTMGGAYATKFELTIGD